tara:strand:- start:372 stop:482 length:111 start_codon:yes stop_codon:yes gene_type:complete
LIGDGVGYLNIKLKIKNEASVKEINHKNKNMKKRKI